MTPKQTDQYSEREAQDRLKKALAGALSMPPKPHAESSPKKPAVKRKTTKK
jgi:hypothetical protein